MKRLLTTITVAALALSLSACSASLEETKQQALDKVQTLDLPPTMTKDGLKQKILEAQTADKVQAIMEEAQAKIEKAQQEEEQRKKDEEAIAAQIAGTYQYVSGAMGNECELHPTLIIKEDRTAVVNGYCIAPGGFDLDVENRTWKLLKTEPNGVAVDTQVPGQGKYGFGSFSFHLTWQPGKNNVGDLYKINDRLTFRKVS